MRSGTGLSGFFCMTFEEKYFSRYILLADQILILLVDFTSWEIGQLCVLKLFVNVRNLEINLDQDKDLLIVIHVDWLANIWIRTTFE